MVHATKPAPTAEPTTAGSAVPLEGVRVRMYRHGLGDCFLVRLPREEGEHSFHLLIDCGLIAMANDPKVVMAKVVADLSDACGGHLDVVILTHEHWDHVSGFSTQQAQAAFDKIKVDEVWYAWTEDPDNALARKLRRERDSGLAALQRATLALRARGTATAARRVARIESLLRFFGVDGAKSADLECLGAAGGKAGRTRQAFEYLGRRRGVKTRYCKPGNAPIALAGVPGVRAYVLGPPEDETLLRRSLPTKKGKEVYEFGGEFALDMSLAAAFERLADPAGQANGQDRPFDASFARRSAGAPSAPSPRLDRLVAATWDNPGEEWRRIEEDWTAAVETLALNLDRHTNNTCLVVALELVRSGRVLLFAADAQVGNWLSWQDVRWQVSEHGGSRNVTGPELLERTVFYKVGHHGSHNATLRALGLEQMKSQELIAFVPVFKEQAVKSGWHALPFPPLVKRLREKTGGRLVLSDDQSKAPGEADLTSLSREERDDFGARLTSDKDGLYYEYVFDD